MRTIRTDRRELIVTGAYEALSRSERRRLLRHALVRPTVGAGIWFVLYFTLPMDQPFGPRTIVLLAVGLCVFIVVVAFQARAIARSPYPRLTAITALAFSLPLFVVGFATVYYLLARSAPAAFTQSMTRLDSLYYTVTVLTTVGFGDIAPRSELARGLATGQMIGDLLLIGLVVRTLLGAVQTGLAGRKSAPDAPAPTEAGRKQASR